MTMITAKFVDPPQDPDPASGMKGRKSWKVTDQNGNKYFARADAGSPKELQDLPVQIKKGGNYELEVNADKRGNNWINDAKEGGAPASAPAPEAGPAASSWGSPDARRTRSIICQSIIKACAAQDGSQEQANRWLSWHDAQVDGVDMQAAVDSIASAFSDARRTGFAVNVKVQASVDLETNDFNIPLELWDDHTDKIISLVDSTMGAMSFAAPEKVSEWWKRQVVALGPLKEKDPETFEKFKERAIQMKNDLTVSEAEDGDGI